MDSKTFSLWTCECQLIVADGSASQALSTVRPILAEVERAADRFNPRSEISGINQAALRGDVAVRVSPVLKAILEVTFEARALTGGLVDPEATTSLDGGAVGETEPAYLEGERLFMARGSSIDLGCLAKPLAADWCAQALGAGVLVNLGGDIACTGEHSWLIEVCDGPDEPSQDVQVTPRGACGVATSSALHRPGHLISPATRLPATPRWRTVTVWAETCTLANSYTTAAALSDNAVAFLASKQVSARLVGSSGAVHIVGDWPVPHQPTPELSQ